MKVLLLIIGVVLAVYVIGGLTSGPSSPQCRTVTLLQGGTTTDCSTPYMPSGGGGFDPSWFDR
jgi:hypothetical protein